MSGELNSLINLSCWEPRSGARTLLGAGMGPPAKHCPAGTGRKEQELSLNLSRWKDKACSNAMADFIHSQRRNYCNREAHSLRENTVLPWSSGGHSSVAGGHLLGTDDTECRRSEDHIFLLEVWGSHLPICSFYEWFFRAAFQLQMTFSNQNKPEVFLFSLQTVNYLNLVKKPARMKSIQQFEDKIGRRLYCAWTHRVNSLIHQPTVTSGTAPRRTSAAFTPLSPQREPGGTEGARKQRRAERGALVRAQVSPSRHAGSPRPRSDPRSRLPFHCSPYFPYPARFPTLSCPLARSERRSCRDLLRPRSRRSLLAPRLPAPGRPSLLGHPGTPRPAVAQPRAEPLRRSRTSESIRLLSPATRSPSLTPGAGRASRRRRCGADGERPAAAAPPPRPPPRGSRPPAAGGAAAPSGRGGGGSAEEAEVSARSPVTRVVAGGGGEGCGGRVAAPGCCVPWGASGLPSAKRGSARSRLLLVVVPEKFLRAQPASRERKATGMQGARLPAEGRGARAEGAGSRLPWGDRRCPRETAVGAAAGNHRNPCSKSYASLLSAG